MDPSMKRELSLGLQEELRKQVGGGENVLISLPGSFGEALAVTDRRVLVIRDCERTATSSCSVYGYPLGTIRGAETVATSTGGYIQLTLATPVTEPDQARVYFPTYDSTYFQKAAEAIAELVAAPVSAAAPAAGSGASPAGITACPKCSSAVAENAVYCGQCGHQLKDICPECGGASLAGSDYCSMCGKRMIPFAPACARCGSRVQRWMSYCTDCGAAQHQSCVACGSTIQSGWSYCGNCGRELGSGFVDPSAARAAQRRLGSFKEAQREQSAPKPPAAEPPTSAPDAAAYHNERGRELFDAEDLDRAIEEFKQAVALDPGNASYRCNLAVAYDENDQDDLAMNEYTRALQLDPNDLTALLSMGYVYNEQGQQDKAAEVWGRILEIAPHTPEAQEVRQNLARQDEL